MADAQFERARNLIEERLTPFAVRLSGQIGPDHQPFGNAFACFTGEHVCFRLVFDRGDLYLTLTSVLELDPAGESSHWYPLDGVLEFLGVPRTPEAPNLSTLVLELDHACIRWSELSDMFSDWTSSKPHLDAFLRRRFEELTRPGRS